MPPAAAAAHYTMGGIAVDLEGRSSVAGLYAVGECACTGLHGANRLASNSLTECFVLGARAAAAAHAAAVDPAAGFVAAVDGEAVPPQPEWRFDPPPAETREALWALAGPRRRADQLE